MLTVEQFEKAMLDTLGLEVTDHAIGDWAADYRALTDAVIHKRGASGLLDRGAVPAALVHGARTFGVATELLSHYPPPPGRFIELGAGCGPFGLAAASHGCDPVTLMDVSEERLAIAVEAFRRLRLPRPALRAGDARTVAGRYSAIAAPFLLAELIEDDEGATKLVKGWLTHLLPGGRLYLLEPGDRENSQRVQRLRDRLVRSATVLAPCPYSAPCPMNGRPEDWCHTTLRLSLGPIGRRIAERAQRKGHELHFSWLVLGREPQTDRDDAGRVLEIDRGNRNKVSLRACMAGELVLITALKRSGAAFDRLHTLGSGSVVRVDRSAAEAKGDGLRITAPDAVKPLSPL